MTSHESNGGTFTATTVHTYYFGGVFTITVWIDDTTELPGHNTSGVGLVNVYVPPYLPYISDFHVSDDSPMIGQTITFNVTAASRYWVWLLVTVDFGDGTSISVYSKVRNESVEMSHAYSSQGVYVAKARAFNGQMTSTDAVIEIEVVTASFSSALAAGWNFVCVPLVGCGLAASTIGLSFGDVIAGWNSSTQTYDRIVISGITPQSLDFPIVEGTGYWIYSDQAKSLTTDGDLPATIQVIAVDVPIGGGWIELGFVGLNYSRNASDIPKMYDGTGTIAMVVKYDELLGTFVPYLPGVPLTDFALVPGHAYWCYCSDSGTISYDP